MAYHTPIYLFLFLPLAILCYAICPKEAISMVEDEEGFEYPQVDESKCVRCYQCIKVCPIKAAKAQ